MKTSFPEWTDWSKILLKIEIRYSWKTASYCETQPFLFSNKVRRTRNNFDPLSEYMIEELVATGAIRFRQEAAYTTV